jgi:hypothetical protein
MSDFHKELLTELTKDWTVEQLEVYIGELRLKAVELDRWIAHIKALQKKKVKKPVFDTDSRGGKG